MSRSEGYLPLAEIAKCAEKNQQQTFIILALSAPSIIHAMNDWRKFEHRDGYCGRCCKQVTVKRRVVRHTPHVLMTIVTLGIWIPRWWRAAQVEPEQWRCCSCHQEVYKLMRER